MSENSTPGPRCTCMSTVSGLPNSQTQHAPGCPSYRSWPRQEYGGLNPELPAIRGVLAAYRSTEAVITQGQIEAAWTEYEAARSLLSSGGGDG
jgi:hypothetical protein